MIQEVARIALYVGVAFSAAATVSFLLSMGKKEPPVPVVAAWALSTVCGGVSFGVAIVYGLIGLLPTA